MTQQQKAQATLQQSASATGKPMTGPLKGLPLPDTSLDYAKGYWEGAKRHELCIQRCLQCKKLRHLPYPMCPHCHSLQYDWARVSGRGRIYSYVVAYHPVHPALQEQVPYNLSLIELEEQAGLRVLGHVLQCPPESLYVGMPVQVTFVDVNEEVTLPVFAPVPEAR
ncbi:MAG: OB-fold domain-containing protein [Chloroflexi bacterium]|nr:OB-fold domain-containing protein [Chloroflexota bacterium]